MSDLLSDEDDDEGARRHAAWGMAVLALVAVIVIAVMLFIFGTSPSKDSKDQAVDTGPATTVVSSRSAPPPSTKSATVSGSASSGTSTSALPSPGDTVHPCPSTAACIVSGDVGGAIDAINRLRTSHGVPAVAGSVSVGAQQCALQQGEGPSCAPHFAWQPVPKPDGALAVSKIDQQWLLDRAATSFRVGWAYAPGRAGGAGQWECAVIKI